jgi:hypothetical protein
MKKKSIKHESDFFTHAKQSLGDKAFRGALKKGHKKVYELRLKMARDMIGLNQIDLKGLTQPEVSKIEKRKDMKISTLAKYAKSMGDESED